MINFGDTFIDVPGGTAQWSFAGNDLYDSIGTGGWGNPPQYVDIVITAAETLITSTARHLYPTRVPQEPCTAHATGPGGLYEEIAVTYQNNINSGTATASASYAGGGNYQPSDEVSATFEIEAIDAVLQCRSL